MAIEMASTAGKGDAATRAGGSSFYFAMRIMPKAQREAMFEIYSFCKAVDDIADGDAPRPERLRELAAWRRKIDALYAGSVPEGLQGLARARDRFSLRKEDFLAVIEGMEMDSAADIRAPDVKLLDLYCDRVACAVGRLSVRVFGMDEENGRALAHHLGSALQLTNILRDIDEDAAIGRLYLPREALDLAGIHSTDPVMVAADPRLHIACDFIVARAREHFAKADEVLARFPRRVARVPRIMEKAYQQTLENMIARGWALPRHRVRLGRAQLFRIALRHAF